MDDLIKRLEALTEPSRELDAAVAVAFRILPKPSSNSGSVDWIDKNFPEWRARTDGVVEVVHDNGRGGFSWKPPAFTLNIHAALALTPSEYIAFFIPQFYTEYDRLEERAIFFRGHCNKPLWETATPMGMEFERHESGNTFNPATAIISAICRARTTKG